MLSVPGIASPRVIRQLNEFCAQLGHPYVHRVQDIASSTDMYGKPKVLVLRDNVVRGSIRDLLASETNPLRTFKEKCVSVSHSLFLSAFLRLSLSTSMPRVYALMWCGTGMEGGPVLT